MITLAAGDAWYELPSWLDVKKLVSTALERIFDRAGKTTRPEVDPDLMDLTFQALDDAIDRGGMRIEYGKPNYALAEQLRTSAALFSARKSWQQANELARLAVKENGQVRSWKEFQQLAAPVVENYNQNWLKTEFNTAIRAARSAKEWTQYEANAHLYPNLRYLPSRAATPREEHKPFYGIVKPITDDFWVRHMPPSAWNCLCGAEQTDDPVTPGDPYGPGPAPGLDNNPGITGKLFSDSHPYTKSLTAREREQIDQQGKDYYESKRNEKRGR